MNSCLDKSRRNRKGKIKKYLLPSKFYVKTDRRTFQIIERNFAFNKINLIFLPYNFLQLLEKILFV